MPDSLKIALAGNPNCGKTTMFNDLTGSSQRVGNWPGVTVEKKEGTLKGEKNVVIQDLPGIYSLSPYTLEEVVARNYLIEERPDAIINIVDASNIERNLYLTIQLLELGIPIVVALNMIDVVQKNGTVIDSGKLCQVLGCDIVETSALKGSGCRQAAQSAIALARKGGTPEPRHEFSDEVEKGLGKIQQLIAPFVESNPRWNAIKVFERDQKVIEKLKLAPEAAREVEAVINELEDRYGEDSESIMTEERYVYIGKIIEQCVKYPDREALSTSDKIDKVVTNRILGLPIFAIVMFLVYYLSITTVGTMMTDWVNDGVFGDGFHLYGGAPYEEKVGEYEGAQAKVKAYIEAAAKEGINVEPLKEALENEDKEFDSAPVVNAFSAEAHAKNITAEVEVEGEEGEAPQAVPVVIDDFNGALEVKEPDPAEYGYWIPGIPVMVEGWLDALETVGWLKGLVLDGIVAGVGAVLGFVPQMLVLFLCLALLEDCGYMTRIAFILDRIFRKFGLSGKSFIPMLISTGCGVPGIMASRTIENENDRRMTVMTTTFIPCSAKLPIIALIVGALFADAGWVATSAYFLGIGAIVISGIMLKKTKMFAGDPAPFVMELPAYHMPKIPGVLRTMWQRGYAFIKKAGSIVLLSTILLWFLGSFNWSMDMMDTGSDGSMLAGIGNVVAPLFSPLGWGDWKATVASINGLIAKENVVGAFGVLYGFAETSEDGIEFWGKLRESFTPLSGYSFLIFNLICAPCFAAIGALRREMMSAKWTLFAVGYQTVFAYVLALVFYQIGMLIYKGAFGFWTVIAIILALGIVYALLRKPYDKDRV